MPTYSYACADCEHRFDIYQSFDEDSLTTCPECQGRLRKVFNSVGVVFKGSGFYRTDSRAAADAGRKESSSSGSGSSSSSASGSSDSGSSGSGSAGSGTSGSGTSGSGARSSSAASGSGSSGSGSASAAN